MPTHATITRALLVLALGSACGGGGGTEPPLDTVVAVVTVNAAKSTMPPGSALQLTAKAKNSAGLDVPGTASWSSSATGVATVSSTGLVTAVANGTAQISATVSGVVGTRAVTVQPAIVESSAIVNVGEGAPYYSFSPNQVDITTGGTVTFNFATAGGVAHDVTFEASSSPANVPLSSSGNVNRTFPTAGTYTYYCSIHGKNIMSGTVTVH